MSIVKTGKEGLPPTIDEMIEDWDHDPVAMACIPTAKYTRLLESNAEQAARIVELEAELSYSKQNHVHYAMKALALQEAIQALADELPVAKRVNVSQASYAGISNFIRLAEKAMALLPPTTQEQDNE